MTNEDVALRPSTRDVRLSVFLLAVPLLLWIPPVLFLCRINGYFLDRLLLKALVSERGAFRLLARRQFHSVLSRTSQHRLHLRMGRIESAKGRRIRRCR